MESGYIDPNANHSFRPGAHFGERLTIVTQEAEDRTVEFLMQAVAELAKRVVVLEGRVSLLEAITQQEL